MNRQKIIITLVFLLLTGVTTALIMQTGTHQRLGAPGVLTQPLPGTKNLLVVLPPNVPGYTSMITTQAQIVVSSLPDDTSFGSRVYTAKDGFWSSATVVLMGTDRSSIHKPQVCLTGQGWQIDDAASKVEKIHMQKPFAYELPVMRLSASQPMEIEGKTKMVSAVYVYWFVDGNKFTAEHAQRMWWMARDLLLSGVLDRFSYIAYLSYCEPGQEDATFERMKQLIADSVPQFQLVPKPQTGLAAAGAGH